MRHTIGQRQSAPRGAQRGLVAGCGCSGGSSARTSNPLGLGRIYPLAPYGMNMMAMRPGCYYGTNGQLICPLRTPEAPVVPSRRPYAIWPFAPRAIYPF